MCLTSLFLTGNIHSQQVSVNRIESMPDFPSPYLMRDWKEATIGYDSLVFNDQLTGEYLPLIFFRNNTINYPGEISFGFHTFVGTAFPNSGEAINAIPAVVGASLVGIDKSNQNGYDWVKMCREYFNKRPEENVYLNHPNTQSADDWWYATMPNVFFYQLYDLYPNTEDFDYQLRSVADQWLKAVEEMGGSTSPWDVPYMNYRGWSLATMTPFAAGVKEPEAAGAIAWLLYNAYKETGEIKYRVGAEWAMEFLNGLNSNPAYELQLSYGTYIAAKMNAELGTDYDLEKLFNWCFDISSLRNWGSIVGKWGGLDVSGLIGEVNGNNDYAFLMNTFEQAGALVPLVRYDDRFAKAVGKWMLNAANAARLFYTNYLPDNNQDSEEWSHQYDPNSYIGHEAMRQSRFGQSPYATGDAIDGGWGETNLALYGSSHVGIFGSIIDTTNVEGILKLDLLKTDYFNDDAYPTYLFFNPYDENKTVEIDVSEGAKDIYETTANRFLINNVSGLTQIDIPSKSAIVVVLTPPGGSQTYELNKFMIDNVIVDYRSGQAFSNYPPRIKALAAKELTVLQEDTIQVYCTAADNDGDEIGYQWIASDGEILNSGKEITWVAPALTGKYNITVEVNDNNGDKDAAQIEIEVVEAFNTPPVIWNLKAEPRKINLGAETTITCSAKDNENDDLTYSWLSMTGAISGTGSTINWTAPNEPGNYFVVCFVSDTKNAETIDSIEIAVRDLSVFQTGSLVCYYPLDGNANDESGNNNNGIVSGAALVSDRFNEDNKAYFFDGSNDVINITNNQSLNFEEAISVNFWININSFFDREQYPISHGNWEDRWKVSITDDRIRWTINTGTGIADLDSETILQTNAWYNVTALYSGTDMEIYLNNELDAFQSWSSTLNQTDLDLTIASAVPGNSEYNFRGVLDDIHIYDYALSLNEIDKLYDVITNVEEEKSYNLPTENQLYQNYPNPFNSETNIRYQINNESNVKLEIFDVLGQKIITLINENKTPGYYSVKWNGKNSRDAKINSGIYIIHLKTGNYTASRKMILLN